MWINKDQAMLLCSTVVPEQKEIDGRIYLMYAFLASFHFSSCSSLFCRQASFINWSTNTHLINELEDSFETKQLLENDNVQVIESYHFEINLKMLHVKLAKCY